MGEGEISFNFSRVKEIFRNNYAFLFSVLTFISLVLLVLKISGFQKFPGFVGVIFTFASANNLVFLTIVLALCAILSYINKMWAVVTVIILAILFMTFSIRTQNVAGLKDSVTGDWTLAPDLDPFLFLRNAREISQGVTDSIDEMRYTPSGGARSYVSYNLMPWSIFYFYKVISVFSDMTLTQAAIFAPVFFFILSTLSFLAFMYFVSRFKFDREKSIIISVVSTLLYVSMPGMLHRTVAGVPELESLGMIWFWLAFLFFAMAWKTDQSRKEWLYGALSGFFTGVMAWSWGGYRYIYMTLGVLTLVFFLFEKNPKKNIRVFSSWILVALVLEFLKVDSFGVIFRSISDTGFALFVFYIILTDFLMKRFGIDQKLKINEINLPSSIKNFLLAAIVLVFILAIFDFSRLVDMLSSVFERLLYPFGRGRTGLTVAENRPAYFTEIFSNFGALIWVFLFGLVVIFYEAFKHVEKTEGDKNVLVWLIGIVGLVLIFVHREIGKVGYGSVAAAVNKVDIAVIITVLLALSVFVYAFIYRKRWLMINSSFLAALVGLTLTRIAPQNLLNGETFISKSMYIGTLCLLVGVCLWLYVHTHRRKEDRFLTALKDIDFSYVLILILSFWIMVSMRGAIRLLFIVSPVIAVVVGFVPVKIYEYTKRVSGGLKWIFWGGMIIVSFLILGAFIQNTSSISSETKSTIPSLYDYQWQEAMSWVRGNTPVGSVFVHWWDYGYWIQTVGQRPTVTDGGHEIGYWDHLTGRYLLTTPYPETALSLMKTYNVSYLLLDSTDVGKYAAYSKIGSDEGGSDRFSFMPVLTIDDAQTRETNDSELLVYSGGFYIDEDINYDNGGQNIFLPKDKAAMVAVLIDKQKNVENAIGQPRGVFVYNQQQVTIPIRYAYMNNQIVDFGGGLDAGVVIFPLINSNQPSGGSLNAIGATMYLSPKVFNGLFAQLYLMNDPFKKYPTLKLVQSTQDKFISSIKGQGANIGDIVYYNGFRGPIKIWKVSYPDNVLVRPEFLKTDGGYAKLDNLQFTK